MRSVVADANVFVSFFVERNEAQHSVRLASVFGEEDLAKLQPKERNIASATAPYAW